jgi:ABC transporter substrate binding protein (PQQ-dependent alcohol dehydrogenase system)
MSFALRGCGYWVGLASLCAGLGAGLSTNATAAAPALTVPVALVSLANDPRYAPRRLERAYPGHPTGRILDAAQMAVNDTALELQESGITLVLREFSVADAAELPKTLAALKAAGVHHLVVDLPAGLLEPLARQAPAALGGAVLINTSADDDALRNTQCAPALLHTTPSRAMLTDALAQYLAARNWRKLLLLQGPLPADQFQAAALQLSAKKFGLKVLQTKPFKLSGDPRERDLFNTRLLTTMWWPWRTLTVNLPAPCRMPPSGRAR